MQNKSLELLVKLGVCHGNDLTQFWPCTRDRDDITVLRCPHSGVILLDRTDHITNETYSGDSDTFEYWSTTDRKASTTRCLDDDQRRATLITPFIQDKRWLDIGTGAGGLLDLCADLAHSLNLKKWQERLS